MQRDWFCVFWAREQRTPRGGAGTYENNDRVIGEVMRTSKVRLKVIDHKKKHLEERQLVLLLFIYLVFSSHFQSAPFLFNKFTGQRLKRKDKRQPKGTS